MKEQVTKVDYTKQCWVCGKVSMVAKGNYYQCSECGATWNKPPALGVVDMVIEQNITTGGTKYKPTGTKYPTGKKETRKRRR